MFPMIPNPLNFPVYPNPFCHLQSSFPNPLNVPVYPNPFCRLQLSFPNPYSVGNEIEATLIDGLALAGLVLVAACDDPTMETATAINLLLEAVDLAAATEKPMVQASATAIAPD